MCSKFQFSHEASQTLHAIPVVILYCNRREKHQGAKILSCRCSESPHSNPQERRHGVNRHCLEEDEYIMCNVLSLFH